MSDMTRVALDAMGGDNAPVEMVKGAVEAVQKRNDIQVLLTGKEEILKEELAKYTYPDEKIHIVNATEVIETAEPPVKAIRSKKKILSDSNGNLSETVRQTLLFRQEIQARFSLEDSFLSARLKG